ncbi:cardiolipin synthase [Leuconostocaceae bacterium ESL0958]|nr:cardiolipin synthase [Leuconostocaceae bacterium ESL0958]
MIGLILLGILALNTVFAIITVFREPRDIAATWAWILVLIFLPVLGFLLYSFAGRKLPQKRLFAYQRQDMSQISEKIAKKMQAAPAMPGSESAERVVNTIRAKSLIELFQNINQTPLTKQNQTKLMNNSQAYFDSLMTDLRQAQDSIHLEFYTFANDQTGQAILDILIERAKAGVEVHVLYDSLGSFTTRPSFFKPLRAVGGHAEPFLKRRFTLIDFQLNFRGHRKVVVIDGKIGYIGGYNIGNAYMGLTKKFGKWRDTHLRITGAAVYFLQAHFLLDWNATDLKRQLPVLSDRYFPDLSKEEMGQTALQIVSSGPDSQDEQIKMGYIRLIQLAKERCWIHTPYLIPDDSTLDALRIAANSGVDVRIMVPCKPDHAFVYRATQYYASQLVACGAKIYYYDDGFLHAKTMLIDDSMGSVGSANLDYRSFKLNFEMNAFIYDADLIEQLAANYEADIQSCTEQSIASFARQGRWLRFKQYVSRLLSPIL